jgi:hypothetical protein
MHDTAALNKKLDDAILAGKAMEAFEELYDEGVVMQENAEPVTQGKAANRAREIEFFKSVEAFHGMKILAQAAHGDVSFSESEADITFKGAGRITMSQVAVRRWANGKLVHERFFHK